MKSVPVMSGSRRLLRLALAALLAAAVSQLPAGIGNLGEALTFNGNSQVSVTLGSQTFTKVIVSGDTVASVRDNLVSQINGSPSFSASVAIDPNDPNAVALQVLNEDGSEVTDFQIAEDTNTIKRIGLLIATGKSQSVLNKVGQVNANGIYTLTVSTWDHGTFSQTFDTTQPPNNTAAGLNNSIRNALQAAGFTVTDDGANFTITRQSDMITATRASTTDTGITIFRIRLTGVGGAVPTLSEWAMFLLVLLLMASAIWMMRRKAAGT